MSKGEWDTQTCSGQSFSLTSWKGQICHQLYAYDFKNDEDDSCLSKWCKYYGECVPEDEKCDKNFPSVCSCVIKFRKSMTLR